MPGMSGSLVLVTMAAPAQAPWQAEPMRGRGDIWPPQGTYPAYSPRQRPGPQSTTVSRAEDTALFVPSRLQNKGYRKKGCLGTGPLGRG